MLLLHQHELKTILNLAISVLQGDWKIWGLSSKFWDNCVIFRNIILHFFGVVYLVICQSAVISLWAIDHIYVTKLSKNFMGGIVYSTDWTYPEAKEIVLAWCTLLIWLLRMGCVTFFVIDVLIAQASLWISRIIIKKMYPFIYWLSGQKTCYWYNCFYFCFV